MSTHTTTRKSAAVPPPRLTVVSEGAARGDHRVQFYDDEGFLTDTVVRFLGAGLAAGGPAVVIATRAHLAAFRRSLESNAFDVERACRAGRLVLLDARETLAQLMVGTLPDAARFEEVVGGALDAAAHGRPKGTIHAFGAMVDLLWKDGNRPAALRLEALWNQAATERSFSLLCAYGMTNFRDASDGAAFHSVCSTHTAVTPAEGYSLLAGDDARQREIALLQQRASALEAEVARCRTLEHGEQTARLAAEAANRSKDEFLAMLGHELRNPLAPIVTALHLMKLRGDVGSSKEQKIIERQVHHVVRLVDDLLDVSRITRGKVMLKTQPINLAEVVAKAVEIAGPLLEQRRHELTVEVPRTGLRLDGDPVRLAQVVANLITNAARYTELEGHIGLAAWRDGHEIVIQVTDDGIGIEKQVLPHLFDLFFQGGPRSSDRAEGGLGIGLALVRSLVQLHGGTVVAKSDGPGKGSAFTVRLPASRRAPGGAGRDVDEAKAAAPATAARRVLIVDDNDDAALMLADVLRMMGHEVRVAHDGPEALAELERFEAEIAILDIGLPVMDGYQLAHEVRARLGARCRLIALTGYGQDHDRRKSERAGFEVHLVKPVDPERVVRLVDRPPQ